MNLKGRAFPMKAGNTNMIYIFYSVLSLIFIGLDFVSKSIAKFKLADTYTLPLIKDVFHLTYCENTGAAFSILSGKTLWLTIVPVIMILAIITYVAVKRPKSNVLLLSVSMIVAGGIGNIIDRIRYGYVVDFFDFRLINFAIFNVADIFVCVGVALLGIYIFFIQDSLENKEK